MPEARRRRKAKIKWVVICLVVVVFLVGSSLTAYLYVHNQQEDAFRQSVIENCKKNGNPLREILQKRIQREIEQDENLPLLKRLLPNVDPRELEVLAAKSIKVLKQEESEIAPINCKRRYSK